MRDPFVRNFKVDNLTYRIALYPDYSTDIRLLGGTLLSGQKVIFYEDGFHWNASPYGSKNNTGNPLKIIRKFAREFRNIIYERRPPIVYFSAIEKKRQRIYYKLFNKYKPVGYSLTYDENSGIFMLLLE
jgi:hypothetical protein